MFDMISENGLESQICLGWAEITYVWDHFRAEQCEEQRLWHV